MHTIALIFSSGDQVREEVRRMGFTPSHVASRNVSIDEL
jgi:hypothetical protein